MNEVQPGLWIGSLKAITQLDSTIDFHPRSHNINTQQLPPKKTRWTIISILNDSKLVKFVRAILSSERYHQAKHVEIVNHLIWELPDTVQDSHNFVSPKLQSILETIDHAIQPASVVVASSITIATIPITQSTEAACCLVHCARGISRSAAVVQHT